MKLDKTLTLFFNVDRCAGSGVRQSQSFRTALKPTKRIIASQTAKVFDLRGWFAPITVKARHLLQLLWKSGISGDEVIPSDLHAVWINKFPVSRKLVEKQATVQQIQLHGFSDASRIAYGAVVYARYLHRDSTVHTSLELCAAKLLAQLISTTACILYLFHVISITLFPFPIFISFLPSVFSSMSSSEFSSSIIALHDFELFISPFITSNYSSRISPNI